MFILKTKKSGELWGLTEDVIVACFCLFTVDYSRGVYVLTQPTQDDDRQHYCQNLEDRETVSAPYLLKRHCNFTKGQKGAENTKQWRRVLVFFLLPSTELHRATAFAYLVDLSLKH